MTEIRQDIFTGEWVIYAASRKNRPYEFPKKSKPLKMPGKCVFCPGSEELTPKALYQNGTDGKWTIRVVPNKYPAIDMEPGLIIPEDFYISAEGKGFHEVLIDTPKHNKLIHTFDEAHIAEIFRVLKNRSAEMLENKDVTYVQVIKNCGPDSGASLMHSHWQILGIPVMPKRQRDVFSAASKYFAETGKCLMCSLLEHEVHHKVRVVNENDDFVVLVPYAAKLSYETWIVPKVHLPGFSYLEDGLIESLSRIFKDTLERIASIMDGVSYNICFQDAPKASGAKEFLHWYIRILPRLSNMAGFEFATEGYINPVLPEDAAQRLRNFKKK